MSVEPPSSGRPTGPPSGPLSGPSQPGPSEPTPTQPSGTPPSGPPRGASGSGGGAGGPGSGGHGPGDSGAGGASGPSGPGDGTPGPDGSGKGGGPDRPWWKSAPRIALITGVVAAAVILGIVFTGGDGGSGGGGTGKTQNAGSEVFLQAADKTGPDPFTESTAQDSSTEPQTPTASGSSEPANVTRAVSGSAPGLYGGTRNVASCDVEKQISALDADPAKNKAFASVEGIQPSAVPAYLRSLTPVQLRMDTRVTNHGYRAGAPTAYQAVLQAGTAVLVDAHGVPRVRCACGNPLLAPVPQKGTPKPTGDSWPGYRPQNVVVVAPSKTVIDVFVIFDPDSNEWIARHKGADTHRDEKTRPPESPSPSVSESTSASPCGPGDSCPPSSASPGSSSPSTPSSSPSSEAPKTPSSEPPSTATESAPASGSASDDLTTHSSSASSGLSSSTTTGGAPRASGGFPEL
ncbi:DUF6777 domain-containing protein [Streptomyces sp. NPDC002131]|uniref:DUF6777 domain-containing protein n=1 Tax=Streptomyces sp. NPDC002131 TaxID=3154535 RepID=UPI003327230A